MAPAHNSIVLGLALITSNGFAAVLGVYPTVAQAQNSTKAHLVIPNFEGPNRVAVRNLIVRNSQALSQQLNFQVVARTEVEPHQSAASNTNTQHHETATSYASAHPGSQLWFLSGRVMGTGAQIAVTLTLHSPTGTNLGEQLVGPLGGQGTTNRVQEGLRTLLTPHIGPSAPGVEDHVSNVDQDTQQAARDQKPEEETRARRKRHKKRPKQPKDGSSAPTLTLDVGLGFGLRESTFRLVNGTDRTYRSEYVPWLQLDLSARPWRRSPLSFGIHAAKALRIQSTDDLGQDIQTHAELAGIRVLYDVVRSNDVTVMAGIQGGVDRFAFENNTIMPTTTYIHGGPRVDVFYPLLGARLLARANLGGHYVFHDGDLTPRFARDSKIWAFSGTFSLGGSAPIHRQLSHPHISVRYGVEATYTRYDATLDGSGAILEETGLDGVDRRTQLVATLGLNWN